METSVGLIMVTLTSTLIAIALYGHSWLARRYRNKKNLDGINHHLMNAVLTGTFHSIEIAVFNDGVTLFLYSNDSKVQSKSTTLLGKGGAERLERYVYLQNGYSQSRRDGFQYIDIYDPQRAIAAIQYTYETFKVRKPK